MVKERDADPRERRRHEPLSPKKSFIVFSDGM